MRSSEPASLRIERDKQVGDFLPGQATPCALPPGPDPQPWAPISRAQCWLMAIKLSRAAAQGQETRS